MLAAAILQAGNFLVPLVLLPWFARTLGVSGYGLVAYITAVVAYFVMFVDWGFSLSATRAIAIHRDSRFERSRSFWETIMARILLTIVGTLGLELLCLAFQIADVVYYRLAYLTVWATAFNPVFYFQGIERMGRMAIVQTGIRLCAIPLVMLTVFDDGDLSWAIGVPATAFLVASLANLIVLLRSDEVQWVSPKLKSLIFVYTSGWSLFLSTAAISLYTNTNTVVLGLVAGNAAVGYFSSAMVFIKAAQGLYQPISQVFFPKLSRQFLYDPNGAAQLFLRLLKWQSLLTLIGSLGLLILSPWLVRVLLGEGFDPVSGVLYWLAPMLLLIGVSNVLGLQGMIPLGYNQAFTRIVIISGAINVALVTSLGAAFGANGGAMAVLIAEGCVALMMAKFLMRHEPRLFRQTV